MSFFSRDYHLLFISFSASYKPLSGMMWHVDGLHTQMPNLKVYHTDYATHSCWLLSGYAEFSEIPVPVYPSTCCSYHPFVRLSSREPHCSGAVFQKRMLQHFHRTHSSPGFKSARNPSSLFLLRSACPLPPPPSQSLPTLFLPQNMT